MGKIKKIKIEDIFFLILIWLPIYQDSKLYNIMGSFGHAPIAIFSIFTFIYCLIRKKIKLNRYFKGLYTILILMMIISVFSTLIYICGNSIVFGNENLIIKCVKGYMYFFAIVCYITSFVTLSEVKTKEEILRQFRNIFLFLSAILIIEYFTLPSAFSFLHAIRPNNYYRIRLLTSESSWTTTIVIVYFILSVAYCYEKKAKKQFLLVIALFILFIITTTSKSLMLLSFICLVIYILYDIKKMLKKISEKISKNKIPYICVALIVLILISCSVVGKLIELFTYDIKNSTSISTRLYSIYCGIEMAIKNPIGYGTSVYLPYLKKCYSENLNIFNTFPWFNSTEIVGLINSGTDASLAIKSGIIQYTLYWGVLGTIMFFKLIYEIYIKLNDSEICSKEEKRLYKSCLITLMIFISLVSSFDYKYEIWSFIAYLIYIIVKNKDKKKE